MPSLIKIERGDEPPGKGPRRREAPGGAGRGSTRPGGSVSPAGAAEPPGGATVTINLTWLLGLALVVAMLGGGAWLGYQVQRGGTGLGWLGGGAAGTAGGGAVAEINGQPLTERHIDVEQAVQKVLQAQTGRVLSESAEALKSFRRELVSQVIDQFILLQAARAAGVSVTDAEVDAELPRMLGQYGLDGATLQARVVAQGIADAEFREWAQRQIVNGRYMQTPAAVQLAGGMGASPEQVAAALRKTADIVLYMNGEAVRPVKEGEPAPDFALLTPDGETVRLSDLRGKPVMVNFWATWCGPCKIEMPLFIDAYNKHKDKLVILGVDVQETPDQVKLFATQMGLTFPLVIDPDGSVSTIYQVRGLPTTIFVNADGVVEAAHRGAILSRPQLEPYLNQILTE